MPDLFGMQTMTPKQQIAHIAEHYGATDEFEDWLTVLKKKKTASTPTAWKRRLKKVVDLIEAGQNIVDVFAQSADSGWTGLFEVRDGSQNIHRGNGQRETPVQRSERLEREALGISH